MANPYIIEDVDLLPSGTEGWFKGTILGSYGNGGIITETPVNTNMAVGTENLFVPVQLPSSPLRDAVNPKENDVIVVLKGANTVVTNGNDVFFNMTGNPGMAMGGTGDMLSGIIGAFLAQGLEPIEAAKAGVYIHGRCGDIAKQEISERGMTVDDMIYVLGALMSEFE